MNHPSPNSSSIETQTALAGLSVQSAHFEVDCYQANDRIGHRIYLGSDLVLSSVEDFTTGDWPKSPPFQQIVSEPLGADKKPVLLGVGMSGKSHWSASIESDSLSDAIAFDMACRVAQVPAFLGSTYKLHGSWNATVAEANQAVLTDSQSGAVVYLNGIGRVEMSIVERILTIRCEIDEAMHTRGKTYRWRYAVSVKES